VAAQGGGIRGGLHLTLGVGSVGLPFKARGTGPGLALEATTPEGLVVDQQLVTGADGLLSAEWTVANRGTEPRQIAPRLVCDTRPGLSIDPLAVTPRRGFGQCVPAGRDGAYYVVAPVRTLKPGESWRGVASVAPGEPPISGRAGPSILSYCDDWTFYRSPELSGTRVAPGATTGVAGYLEGNHTEWAIQWGPPTNAVVSGKTYIVRARMRVERTGDAGGAFTAGAYDTDDRVGRLQAGRTAAEVPAGEWFEVEWGRVTWDKGTYLWVAPTANPSNVQRVWVDWIRLDPGP
jgi:hypothetical protein